VLEGELWEKLRSADYEISIAKEDLSGSEVLELLDFVSFFELAKTPLPSEQKDIIKRLIDEEFVVKQSDSRYSITNLGALAFAKRLSAFDRLERKAVRVVRYEGRKGVGKILKDNIFDKRLRKRFQRTDDVRGSTSPFGVRYERNAA